MDTSSTVIKDARTEDEVILRAQNTQEIGEDIRRTLAAEVIRHRRALRSHSRALAKMNSKYLEVRSITKDLKKIIEGTGRVGGIGNLHFSMLQVPQNKGNHN